LLLNHRIDFRRDSELQVAVKFGAVNFHRELSQIHPTVCVIISKTALKQVFMTFGKALPNHCFAQTCRSKQIFGGAKDFAQIFLNLPKKLCSNSSGPFFGATCFSANFGRHFNPDFHGFCLDI